MALDFSNILGTLGGISGVPMLGQIGGMAGQAINGIVGQSEAEKLQEAQELLRQQQMDATLNAAGNEATKPQLRFGGSKDLVHYKGPSHEFGGIKLADTEVEGNETAWGNYVFSNVIGPETGTKSFAQMSKDVDKKYYRLNDPFSSRSREAELRSLVDNQEAIRSSLGEDNVPKQYLKCGGTKYKGRKMALGGFSDDPRFGYVGNPNSYFMGTPDPINPTEVPPALQGIGAVRVAGNTDMPSFSPKTVTNLGSTPTPTLQRTTENLMSLPTLSTPSVSTSVTPDIVRLEDRPKYTAPSDTNINQSGSVGLNPLLAGLPGLASIATNAILAGRTEYPTITARTTDANLLDPTRALNELQSAYSGAMQNAANIGGGAGFNSLLASAANRAKQAANIAGNYENQNAQILNQNAQFNANQMSNADRINLAQRQESIQDTNAAIAGIGAGVQQTGANILQEYARQLAQKQMLQNTGTPNVNYAVVDGKLVQVLNTQSGDNAYQTLTNPFINIINKETNGN